MSREVQHYVAAGVRSVWVIAKVARTPTQHRSGVAAGMLAEPDGVVEDPVLLGFTCRLRDLLGD